MSGRAQQFPPAVAQLCKAQLAGLAGRGILDQGMQRDIRATSAEVGRARKVGRISERRELADADAACRSKVQCRFQGLQRNCRDPHGASSCHFPVEIHFADLVRHVFVESELEFLPRGAVGIDLDVCVHYLAARKKQVCRHVVSDQRHHCIQALFEICAFDSFLGDFRPRQVVPVHQPDNGRVEFETPRISHKCMISRRGIRVTCGIGHAGIGRMSGTSRNFASEMRCYGTGACPDPVHSSRAFEASASRDAGRVNSRLAAAPACLEDRPPCEPTTTN